jgi:hypothetical protein
MLGSCYHHSRGILEAKLYGKNLSYCDDARRVNEPPVPSAADAITGKGAKLGM